LTPFKPETGWLVLLDHERMRWERGNGGAGL
jgi:hypothetical protein